MFYVQRQAVKVQGESALDTWSAYINVLKEVDGRASKLCDMTPNLRGKCFAAVHQNKEEPEQIPAWFSPLISRNGMRLYYDNNSLEITVIHECGLIESHKAADNSFRCKHEVLVARGFQTHFEGITSL